MIARISAAGFGLLALAVFASPSTAQNALQLPRLRVHQYPGNVVSLYAQLGVSRGLYKDVGLNVELVKIATGPQSSAALASGSIDITLNTPDGMISFKDRGQSPVAVVGNLVKPLFVVIARNPASFPKLSQGYPAVIDDLQGKKIGVYGLGGSSDRIVKLLLKDAGKPANAVQFVALGGPAQSLTALASDRVDATVEVFSTAITADLSGLGKMLLDCSEQRCPNSIEVSGRMGQAYWTTTEFLKKNEATIRLFSEAHKRIDSWVHDPANKEALHEELVKLVPAPPNVDADKYFAALMRDIPKYFGVSMDPLAIKAIQDAMISTGELQSQVSLDGMVWSDALSK